jgi:hypothetical protein
VTLAAVTLSACGFFGGPTTTTTAAPARPASALWPFASGAVRYHTATAVARAFAVHYVGMAHPVLEGYHAGGRDRGVVSVAVEAGAPVMSVSVVRSASADRWWVSAAASPDVVLEQPAAGALISSPVTLAGRSTAYEAVVNVTLRRDGSLVPVATGTVRGGSMGVVRAFRGSLAFAAGAAPRGSLMLYVRSAKDGGVVEATVVRVRFR